MRRVGDGQGSEAGTVKGSEGEKSPISTEVDTDCIAVNLDLNKDGNTDYELRLSGIDEEAKPEVTLQDATEHQYMTRYTYTIELNDIGQVLLDMDYVFNQGLVYYIEYAPYDNGKELTMDLIAGKQNGLEVARGFYNLN